MALFHEKLHECHFTSLNGASTGPTVLSEHVMSFAAMHHLLPAMP